VSHHIQRISVFMIAAGTMLAQTTTPPNVAPESRTSGVIGIAPGQTARVNVLNLGNGPAATASGTAVACAAVLTFYDAGGAQLKTSTITVAPGTAGHLDLFSDIDLALAVGVRREIRAVFSTLPILPPASSSAASAAPSCRLIGNLEIFDSVSGRSEVVIGAMHRDPPEPTPSPAAKQ